MEETEQTEQPKDMVDEANLAALRIEKANQAKSALLDREEMLMAKRALGGQTEAGIPAQKPTPLTDKEYSEKVLKGEANPLKEDGFI